MNLDLTPEQEMLREMVRGVCSSYSPLETVREMVEGSDELRATSPGVEVRGVVDAAGAPFSGGLPWPTAGAGVSWEQYVQDKWTNAFLATWSARVDDS